MNFFGQAPFPAYKSHSLPEAPGALSEPPSLEQHSREVFLCHPRDTLVTICAFISEEREGVQGPEGGGDAVTFGNGCVTSVC